jgi:hypothetical protein
LPLPHILSGDGRIPTLLRYLRRNQSALALALDPNVTPGEPRLRAADRCEQLGGDALVENVVD